MKDDSIVIVNKIKELLSLGNLSRREIALQVGRSKTFVTMVSLGKRGNGRNTISAPERFWNYVEKRGPNDCWPWKGAVNGRGYGAFVPMYKVTTAHRFVYELTHEKLDSDTLVCHTCDNKLCCNPEHLFTGTYYDNNHDRALKGRTRGPWSIEKEVI